jgi:hypothetical protein
VYEIGYGLDRLNSGGLHVPQELVVRNFVRAGRGQLRLFILQLATGLIIDVNSSSGSVENSLKIHCFSFMVANAD